ncbi:OOP family OmpA-OmpF porin [Catalinimonas alkaloidigena]|uniref:OmpA family protein n=1 Tax=Catalinimonas alkaloidigena TaxID=1075417 RepID=UPI0024070656|nr:OmpA family protein [Catalinimonas alkaloidigena]MDF9795779.1 OOP family OmpA-OmpF porin [Catalinimonas alkaloidigena]
MCWIRNCAIVLVFLVVEGFFQHTMANNDDEVLVRLEGKILDAATLKPVSAKFVYKMIPSGSVTGIRMFANENGEYLVQLQKYQKYKIEVSSEDYQPLEIELSTNNDRIIQNDFHLYKIPQKGEVFDLSDKIYFERGKFTINEASIPTLQALADIMQAHPDMKIRLEGHTDRGTLKSLFYLSENRVEEVKRYLVEVNGVNKKRIKTKAFGGTKPISNEKSAKARKQNRRVEVRVIQL